THNIAALKIIARRSE
ncbi:hypothetical protein, partial [Escherichia coli]